AVLSQLVRAAAGLDGLSETGPAAARLEAWLVEIFGRAPDREQRLAEAREPLLDLAGLLPPSEVEPIEPRQRQARLARSFKDAMAALAAGRPLAMVVEDIHWIDESSLDVLDDFADTLPSLPVALLALSRPERLPPWAGRSWYRQVTLSPLQEQHVRELLGALLGSWEVPPPLAERLLERTGGNPFFLEEIVASLR